MDVEFCSGGIVSISIGEHKIDALFRSATGHRTDDRRSLAVLRLHGTLGNLIDETEHFLADALVNRGYDSLSMNTALANLGLFYGFGVFDAVIPQIAAACEYLGSIGYTRIVLAGHGLGAAMAVRYAAASNDRSMGPPIHGVVAVAAPYSLPETIRRRWERFGAEPSYQEVHERAREAHDNGRWAQDEPILIQRAHGPTRLPTHAEIYTLRTWWSLAAPEAAGPSVFRHIGQVTVPLLLINAQEDEVIEVREGEDLGQIARAAGNPDVTQVVLNANHRFDGEHEALCDTVAQWLADRFGG
jgi:alpha-beta hydrolase superfamily lysophospholipase